MLVNVTLKSISELHNDPELQSIFARFQSRHIEDGLYYDSSYNFDLYIKEPCNHDPLLPLEGIYRSPIGVCDSVEQFKTTDLCKMLCDSERKFVVTFQEIHKKNETPNGWRWHKWGPMIGEQEPTTEYLYDEPIIESICAFHIYEIGDN